MTIKKLVHRSSVKTLTLNFNLKNFRLKNLQEVITLMKLYRLSPMVTIKGSWIRLIEGVIRYVKPILTLVEFKFPVRDGPNFVSQFLPQKSKTLILEMEIRICRTL